MTLSDRTTTTTNTTEPNTIKIFTTDPGKKFKVPRSLLISASPWFVSALDSSKPFEEGRKGELRFPETEPVVIEHFMAWLFHGEINEYGCTQITFVRLWVFGDKHFLPGLCNLAISKLHGSMATFYPTTEVIMEGLEGSGDGSALKRFLLGQVCRRLATGNLRMKEVREELGEYAIEILEYLVERSGPLPVMGWYFTVRPVVEFLVVEP